MPTFVAPYINGSIENALNSLIQQKDASSAGNSNTQDARAPLIFTSSLRQSQQKPRASRQAALRDAINEASSTTSVLDRFKSESDITFGIDQGARDLEVRNAQLDLFDLTGIMLRAMPEIRMMLNPKSIEFEQPKRFARQDTMRGSVFHHFTNEKGQNNDLLTIRFQGNTGNINTAYGKEDERVRAKARLVTWQNLYQLTREQIYVPDLGENVVTISYISPLFPINIDFRGFFSKVLSFSESAGKPNSRDYSMEFIVQETSPDLNDIANNIYDAIYSVALISPSAEAKIISGNGNLKGA